MSTKNISTKKNLYIGLIFFILLNIFLYYFIANFHSKVNFHSMYYQHIAYHYIQDPRIEDKPFNLINAMGQWDAQWYLLIAENGYQEQFNRYSSYAFFPLYPLMIHLTNYFFSNIELAAFIFANTIMLAIFFSMYYIVTKLYSPQIALRSIFLLFLFPFSIFFRSYFTEGLFLLLLLWFSYFLIKKKLFLTTIFFAFLCVTRPTGIFLTPIFIYGIYKGVREKTISVSRAIFFLLITSIPFLFWSAYCYFQSGNILMWVKAETLWYTAEYPLISPLYNHILNLASFQQLPIHSFTASKIDTLTIIYMLTLLILSKKTLPSYLWWISFFLIVPMFFIKDTMSISRFYIITFPLYIYLGKILQGKAFIITSIFFYILLLITSLYFVNWHWVG